ncbi:MAG TPA: HAD family hydrolase [Pirellulales bacterium]|nr:HAD family hydrolase [Pirellulales bacterium]
MIRGLIFDLDGTLVDSGLDFERMRLEMGLPSQQPILESLDRLAEPRRSECWTILERHEQAGAERATLMPGVTELLQELARRNLRRAIFTRNGRRHTLHTLARLGLTFDTVVAREDAPPKPDPTGIWQICESWRVSPGEVAMVGDYLFDIEAGRRAGARTVCYAGRRNCAEIETWGAGLAVACFSRPQELLAWLEQPGEPT